MAHPAPIILFAYDRPAHTERTLEALARNHLAGESDLTIFCDGPGAPDREEDVARVRSVAGRARGFRSVRVVERPRNLGLADSVITGVTETLERHDEVIVLEDDLVTAPHFLRYMNFGLRTYRGDGDVISICGYTFPVSGTLPDTFFLPGAFCWGWATWRQEWGLFEHSASKALTGILERDLVFELDFSGTDPLTKILHLAESRDKRVDSWALRWMATACLHRKLTLYPGSSLVANEGFDGTGRHATLDDRFVTPMARRSPVLSRIPVQADSEAVSLHRRLFIRWRTEDTRAARLYYLLASLLPRPLEKRLYSALTRRMLARQARRIQVEEAAKGAMIAGSTDPG